VEPGFPRTKERALCEVLAVAFEEPERLDRVLPWASELERLGVAGFGWGVAWLDDDGIVHGYRRPASLRDDADGRDQLAGVTSERFLIHLRRPSMLSTVQLADTQPFLAGDGRFAFCHNGMLERHEDHRERLRASLSGKADSEIGFRMTEEALAAGAAPAEALEDVYEQLGGRANFAYLDTAGTLAVYAANPTNRMWVFELDGARVASTALHSDDRSVFGMLFDRAEDAEQVRGAVVVAAPVAGRS
jgi:predicted glutamine amidotransferase